MTVIHDAHTESATFTTTSPFTFTHTPAKEAGAVLVMIYHGEVSTDLITGAVTYGGQAMTRVPVSPTDTVTEAGRVYAYFLGGTNLTGVQTVSITHTGSANVKIATCTTVYSDEGKQRFKIGSYAGISEDVANPTVSLNTNGQEQLCYCVVYTGGAGPVSPGGSPTSTILSGMTALSENDFGNFAGGVARQTEAREGSFPIGYTSVSDDNAFLAVSIVEDGLNTSFTWPYPEWDPARELAVNRDTQVGTNTAVQFLRESRTPDINNLQAYTSETFVWEPNSLLVAVLSAGKIADANFDLTTFTNTTVPLNWTRVRNDTWVGPSDFYRLIVLWAIAPDNPTLASMSVTSNWSGGANLDSCNTWIGMFRNYNPVVPIKDNHSVQTNASGVNPSGSLLALPESGNEGNSAPDFNSMVIAAGLVRRNPPNFNPSAGWREEMDDGVSANVNGLLIWRTADTSAPQRSVSSTGANAANMTTLFEIDALLHGQLEVVDVDFPTPDDDPVGELAGATTQVVSWII